MSLLKNLLADLIQFRSITPEDVGCQDYMIRYLEQIGFKCEKFDNLPVHNFFASYGHQGPMLLFAGHTDVVPTGDPAKWLNGKPFTLFEQDGMCYGRGSADMKGSLVSMLIAVKEFIENYPEFKGQIGFLITSGEEGDFFDLGTPYVMEQLKAQGIKPEYCIVGEPSSSEAIADVVKIGRRGSLTGKLKLHGIQGHVAYPHLAENPIHKLAPALADLTSTTWDNGNKFFPPTSLQVTHIESGGEANNIIPGDLLLQFNFRFSTEQSADSLKAAVEACFKRHDLSPEINWKLNGEPFLTAKGRLLETTTSAILEITGNKPELSTSGGTSDGRFIAPFGVEVIELGPINASIHQINECVSFKDLETLKNIYKLLCEKLFVKNKAAR